MNSRPFSPVAGWTVPWCMHAAATSKVCVRVQLQACAWHNHHHRVCTGSTFGIMLPIRISLSRSSFLRGPIVASVGGVELYLSLYGILCMMPMPDSAKIEQAGCQGKYMYYSIATLRSPFQRFRCRLKPPNRYHTFPKG